VGYSGCAGVGQLIANGQTGLLAEGNGSPESLAAALLPLMNDDAMRRRMGAAAAMAMSEYAPGVVFDRWEAVLGMVAGNP
jgi:glycosyltransferase involved in cell wall biosynthesis